MGTTTTEGQGMDLGAVLAQIGRLTAIVEAKFAEAPPKDYSIEQAAARLGRRPFTVREWCRLGQCHAYKTTKRAGGFEQWRIAADELARIERDGLLPADAKRNRNRRA